MRHFAAPRRSAVARAFMGSNPSNFPERDFTGVIATSAVYRILRVADHSDGSANRRLGVAIFKYASERSPQAVGRVPIQSLVRAER